MYRCAATIAVSLSLTGPLGAQDFNDAGPNAPDQAPAFDGQTRAPVLEDAVTLDTQILAEGLEHPWGMDELPDGSWLITERPGRLRLWRPEGGLSEPIMGLPDLDNRGQGGLLDVVIADDFDQSRRLWFSFAESRPMWRSVVQNLRRDRANRTAVATATLSEDGSSLQNMKVIFGQEPFSQQVAFRVPTGSGWSGRTVRHHRRPL